MSEYVRRVAVGRVEETPKGEKFRVRTWLEDLTDDAIEFSPLKSRAAIYFGAVQAHAAAEEARRRLRAEKWSLLGELEGLAPMTLVVRVLRSRLRS